jgi:hypothetical protein
MKRLRVVTVAAVIYLCTHSAFAQVQHGSIGVVVYTSQKIAIAADSRSLSSGESHTLTEYGYPRILPMDDACKIVAIHKQILFVSTGIGSTGENHLLNDWTAENGIRRAYDSTVSIHGTSLGHVKEIANAWATAAADHFERFVIDSDLPPEK